MLIRAPFPDKGLNPNQSKGRHWSATSKLRKTARYEGWVLAREAMQQGSLLDAPKLEKTKGEIAVTITFVLKKGARIDRDNGLASLKPTLDGIAEALGVDDDQFEPVVLRREKGALASFVLIQLEAACG